MPPLKVYVYIGIFPDWDNQPPGGDTMQAKAFVLIETAVGRNKDVANALKKLKGIKSVDIVTGPYDIIAILEAESLNDIGDLVTGQIHPIAGISRTVTCLAIGGA
jgi:DNA-binding Lrp family transcriptional regulator